MYAHNSFVCRSLLLLTFFITGFITGFAEVWGQTKVSDGIYYIKNNNGDWYLWPSVTTNATTGYRYLTTSNATSAEAVNNVSGVSYPAHDKSYSHWVVKNVTGGYIQLINPRLNKYVVIRKKSYGDRDVWLTDEPAAEDIDYSYFELNDDNSLYKISPKAGLNDVNITSNYSFNSAQGSDREWLTWSDTSTPNRPRTDEGRGGLIQCYSGGTPLWSFTSDLLDAPTISNVDENSAVTVTDANGLPDGYNIRYTTDGSIPTASSPILEGKSYTVTSSLTMKAVVERYGILLTEVAEKALTPGPCAAPVITFYNITSQVSITCITEGSTIHYTTDGSTPTTSSTEYGGPFSVSSSTTVKAIATHATFASSTIAELTISQVATPTIQNSGSNAISITTETEGATIYYTIDGSTPTTSSTEYTGPLTENVSNVTIKAIAVKTGMITSAVGSGQVMLQCATPIITRDGMTFTLSCRKPTDASLYYTLGGGSETLYSGPVAFTADQLSMTVTAVSRHSDYTQSETASMVLKNGTGTPSDPYLIYGSSDFANFVTNFNDGTTASACYKLCTDVSARGFTTIATFSGTLEADINPETKMPYRITGLDAPLFATLTGTVKNLVLEDVSISGGDNDGNTGAIACKANSAARIYNIGILSGSVGGTGNAGGLVGLLDGTARVVNCYSYATITGGTNVGGIVGNNYATTTAASINTMVMNCMFYGDITGGTTVSPVYGGTNIANLQGGLNTFNYYAYDELKSTAISNNKYNSALAVEQKYLNRFEFYRLLLNSNKKLAAFYVTGNVADGDQMLKWVLETADRTIDNPKPYPILKAQGKYPSIINPDFENAPDSAFVGRNHGGKLGSKTLSVTIGGVGSNAPSGANISTSSLSLQRTDKDFDRFNYNYDKVQLPYYNDVGTGNYTGNRVVTGWKITAITAISGDPYTSSNYPTTGVTDYPNHNYADRRSSNKDLYSVSGRVFSQGAYFDVPYGVTSITIEPYWGKAHYIADQYYDVVYKDDYSGKQGVTQTGTQVANPTGSTPTMFNGQKVETSITRSLDNIANNMGGLGSTVYDNALVLVGNLHLDVVPLNGDRPFTMMSVDMDNDHEPDYSLIYHHKGRSNITPIRFDFLNIPGTAQAQKPNGASLICNFTIFKTRGWFEITNTALVHSDQLEYENADLGNGVTKIDAPLILLGGVFDQFVSTQNKAVSGKTIYIHVGSNVWIKEFGLGTHSDGSQSTPHVPVSVTGGEFPGFYLTGTYNANATIREDNAECYISGGYFHEAAGASLEKINGSVRWQIYNADIDQFFGGGINEAKPITGNITVDIYNSYVTLFCGGPKFGNMQAGKKVTTNAEGCTFGKFFGAGYGGTSITKKKYYDEKTPAWGTTLQGYYLTDRGLYFDGETTNAVDAKYGKKGLGVATDFDYEFFVWSSGTTGGRFFVKFASFSLAQCNDVSSTLKKCTVNENFYGGGNLGKVVGTATSVLEDCMVHGSAYGGGYSASLPTVEVRDAGFAQVPKYNNQSGMFEPAVLSGTTTFTWQNATDAGKTLTNGQSGSDLVNHVLYTDADLTTLGEVAHTNLTIKGTTTVGESVYGGGEESAVGGNTEVNVQGGIIGTTGSGGAVYGNVYGGGKGKSDDVKAGLVKGNTTVNISSLPDNNKTKVLHNVYGGGAYGSVGTFTYAADSTITGYTSGGQATVNILSGTFGTDGHDNGMIFGSSRGHEGNPLTDTNIDKLAWVYNTVVNVGTAGSAAGPMINGSVYGGGENGHNYQNAAVNIHSGTIGYTSYDPTSGYNCGSVFGAGCGTDKYTVGEVQHYNPLAGTVWGNTTITIDGGHMRHNVYGGGAIGSAGKADGSSGKATITVTGGRIGTDGNDNGNIYGAPRGDSEATDASIAQVVETEVNINYVTTPTSDNAEHTVQLIAGSVFGGGQAGVVKQGVVVNMNGGLVLNDIYGGSALANTNISNVTGYGTSSEAITSTSTYTTALNLHGGIVAHNVYGGGLGRKAATGVTPVAALVYGDVEVKMNETVASDNCIVKGKIFGCNNYNGTPKGTVTVHIYKTVGYDDSHKKSTEKDDTTYDLYAVYGGGNEAAYEPNLSTVATNVIIDGCDLTSIQYVYGGGNAASAPATHLTVNSCYEIGSIFGGGNGFDDLEDGSPNPGADVGLINGSTYGNGDATTSLYGGKVHEAFGGSNFKGVIKGNINLDVHEAGGCSLQVDKIVGAGKHADIDGDIIMVMGCMPTTKTPMVFGGADNANVNGNVELTITSGTFGQVFGGNNIGGIIKGHIKLNIEETGCNPIVIDQLYLGGNQAAYSVFGYYDSGEILPNGKAEYLPRTSETDSHTAIENPSNDDNKHPFPYDQPVLNVISCTSIGSVFGGGLGADAVMYANPTVNINMVQGAFANDLPDNENNPNKLGAVENVYGGGNEAAVYGNTTINIGTMINQNIVLTSPESETEENRTKQVLGAYITGTVYGAGKGLASDPNAAIVTGNTQVNMAGGKVCRSIYGGGELSSVGTFTETYAETSGTATDANYHVKGEPKTCAENTGKTEVIITGGQVGLVHQLMPDVSNPNYHTSDDDYGYVFCAGKGMADPTQKNSDDVPFANLLAISGSSHLKISGGLIAASVYGGSENGQVLGDTYVEIKGGQIGSGHYKENGDDKWDPAYTDEQWAGAIDKIKKGNFTDADAAPFHECDAWPFGADGSRYVYDYYANDYDSQGGAKLGSDGHSYYGHVFGGGSGYYPYAAGKWRRTAGRVNGNTLIEISGGHILTNVYGGNEITDVLGHSKVKMTGGTVGVPRTVAGIQARPVNSYIFGAGMGDPRVMFNGWSNVASSEVIVDSVAVVFGSVFGGGEDGHVLGDATTTIKGNALIGTFGSSGVDGNVFGSGRGFSSIALTAGAVCGNVTVNIAEKAKILGSVFGGGRMAAVGTHLAAEGAANYGVLIPDEKNQVLYGDDVDAPGATHGNVTINITGGTIGNPSQLSSSQYSIGDVFGGSKGVYVNGEWTKSQKLGLVKNTTINISQASEDSPTTIFGNVYGGGEIASVGSYEYATAAEASEYNQNYPTEPLTEGDVNKLLEGGLATVNITGGKIGKEDLDYKKGHVFGGCLGRAGEQYSGYSFVNRSVVTLNGANAHVYGSVFGGGENGHVLDSTLVKIQDGYVGIPFDNLELSNDPTQSNTIYRGNVYGGGRGIDEVSSGVYSITAGKVSGNTGVQVTGGQIYRNVYGGGSLASVGNPDEKPDANGNFKTGWATVSITGGKIGSDGGYHNSGFYTPDGESTPKPFEHRLENGHVFGSGRGVAGEAGSEYTHLAYVKDTRVIIGGTAYITGSVFGSGENGHVRRNANVNINEGTGYTHELSSEDIEHYPIIGYPLTQVEMVETPTNPVLIYRGNVYGGGRGIDHTKNDHLSETAGAVKWNATVNIKGGTIRHNVYGGGSLASTGDITDENGVIIYHGNTGLATINISGGSIGMSPKLDICKNADGVTNHSGYNNGQVYGGARGVAGGTTGGEIESEYILMAYVHDTKVNVSGTAKIFGSVFGGGANGHVSQNTEVNVSGGEIGTNPSFIGTTSNYYYMDPATGIDGHVIYTGNVYGGGRGIDRNEEGQLSATAGRVYGNTKVNVTGGQIYHNVYGGGSLASVGTFTKSGETYTWTENTGKSEVIISGGMVGFEDFSMGDYLTYMGKHPGEAANMADFTSFKFNTGRVFGSGRGMAGQEYNEYAYVRDAYVTIQGTGAVKGNVFGSGENGHVKRNTYVEIKGGEIGYKVPSLFLGNVYGGGRGVDLYNGAVSVSAGRTEGNTNVTVSGGKIYRDIYGGGSLASVGQAADSNTGLATVTIQTGAVVGDDFCVANGFGGNVFGSGRGMVKLATGPDYSQMAYVNRTEVIVKGHVMGNVYGGGNAGHVRNNTHVQIRDGSLVGTNYGGNVYYGNVFGAGKGTSKTGNYSATAGAVLGNVVVDMLGGTVLNDVYGGAALANSNIGNATDYGTASEAISSTSTNTTTVNLVGGTITNAYGGGQGDSETAAIVYGDASVLLNGSTAEGATNNCVVKGNIFGCNNINGTPKGHALVHVYKTQGWTDDKGTPDTSDDVSHTRSATKDDTTYEVAAVYGGGNMAAYVPVSNSEYTEVIIDGCDLTSIDYVYGGGNAASVSAAKVLINGTYELGSVFGGGNGKDALPNGDPNPGANVGLMAYPNAANAAYSTKEERASNYGYGTGKTHVMVYGGTVHEVYGGSNTKGNIRVEARAKLEDEEKCEFNVGEAYGGGRHAMMDGDAVLEIGCIKGMGKAYGGAADADVNGDVVLNITNGTYGQVFGGNDRGGEIRGSITVNIEETGCHPIIIGELYGGGNLAAYTAPTGINSPVVNVKSFTSIGTVFGGGYGAAAKITGNPEVNIDVVHGKYKETVIADKSRVIGSTVKKPGDTGYSATEGFEIPSHAANAIGAIGTVYGGGNAAPVIGNTNINIGTQEYIPVTVAVGDSVTGYYTRSGNGTESSPYTYSEAAGSAVENTTYYNKVVGVDIRDDVFGGGLGKTAAVSGNTNVVIGR